MTSIDSIAVVPNIFMFLNKDLKVNSNKSNQGGCLGIILEVIRVTMHCKYLVSSNDNSEVEKLPTSSKWVHIFQIS